MRQAWFRGLSYYWVVDQAEFSTDLIFTGREALAGLYPRLLDHAVVNFSAKDILTFLGRRFHPRFDGEVLTHCQKGRWPGARIKHRMKNNWLKMYDKFGLVLRIETVINDPREFRVRRSRIRDGRREMVWCPMNKGVINLYRYREVSLAANRALPGGALGGRRPGPGLSSGRGIDRAGGGLRPESCGLQPGDRVRREVVRRGAGWQQPRARVPERRHSRGALRTDRGCRGAATTESVRGPDAEAIARARLDREGAAQSAVARQPEGPSGAGAVVRLYHYGIPAAVDCAA